ncbi:MAG: PEP-CTERM sorting domain-containing protein [Planctomycetota bacterium]
MKLKVTTTALSAALALTTAVPALAHDGRRLDIQINDDQIVTQGYISGSNPTDDGNGIVRDYYNAIHSHWGSSTFGSSSSLPGFDIDAPSDLAGRNLTLTVEGAYKWADAPFSDFAGGHGYMHASASHAAPLHDGMGMHFMPDFQLLDGQEEAIEIYFTNNPTTPAVRSSTLGTLDSITLSDSVVLDAHFDLRFDYLAQENGNLTNSDAPLTDVYLLKVNLTADGANAPSQSDSIHIILSPAGTTVTGSHGLSLAIEEHLGTPIPEPASIALLALGGMALVGRRAR